MSSIDQSEGTKIPDRPDEINGSMLDPVKPARARRPVPVEAVGQPAELALAAREGTATLEQVVAAKVGPERRRDPELGVRDLPEQEIADPHLARGADQEVGIAHPVGVEIRGEKRLVHLIRVDAARPHVFGEPPGGVADLGPAAVIDRQAEDHPVVRRRHARPSARTRARRLRAAHRAGRSS